MKAWCIVAMAVTLIAWPARSVNLAEGKNAEGSSNNGIWGQPDKCVDGDFFTMWQPNSNDGEWFKVDLGQEYTFDKIRIQWEQESRAISYSLEVSNDGMSWNEFHTVNNSRGAGDEITFDEVTGRHIKLTCLARSDSWGMCMMEFQVFPASQEDFDPSPLADGSIAFGKPMSASSSTGSSNPADAVDGFWWSHWQAASNSPGEWLMADLEESCRIDSVMIVWDESRAVRYNIEVSDDGDNWSVAYEADHPETQIHHPAHALVARHRIEQSVFGRYVRMIAHETADGYGAHLYEFAVYGESEKETRALSQPAPGGIKIRATQSLQGIRVDAQGRIAPVTPGTTKMKPDFTPLFNRGKKQYRSSVIN